MPEEITSRARAEGLSIVFFIGILQKAKGDTCFVHGKRRGQQGDIAFDCEFFHFWRGQLIVNEHDGRRADEVGASDRLVGGEARHEENVSLDGDEEVAHNIACDDFSRFHVLIARNSASDVGRKRLDDVAYRHGISP